MLPELTSTQIWQMLQQDLIYVQEASGLPLYGQLRLFRIPQRPVISSPPQGQTPTPTSPPSE